MADIELVIRVPEELYGQLIELENPTFLAQCVIKGKQLPKGHGRLIDADALPLNAIDDANYGSNYIRFAPTIIEADGEESITREEAIKTIIELMIACTPGSKYYKVGEMAIKALEQNESAEEWYKLFVEKLEQEQEPSGDLISRQAVMNILFYESDNNCEVRLSKELRDRIKDLPSVKPQEPCEDAISRQAVLDVWHTSYSDNREENEEIQYKKIAFELPSVNPQEPKIGNLVENLCDLCTNKACEFQFGIQRSKCDFYIPPMPHLEPDNCGNYVVQQEPKTVALLEKTYADFCKCEGGEGWMKIDGKEYSTDVGYAFEGMRIFMEVFKQRLAESEEV